MSVSGFNDVEALKIAINLENDGYELYSRAIETARSPSLESTFRLLAQQELDHKARFQKLLDELQDKGDYTHYIDSQEVEAYIRALVEPRIFPKGEGAEEALSRIKSPEEAIRLGIEAEKNSILFYSELTSLTNRVNARRIFSALIKEEKHHLVILTDELRKLSAQSGHQA